MYFEILRLINNRFKLNKILGEPERKFLGFCIFWNDSGDVNQMLCEYLYWMKPINVSENGKSTPPNDIESSEMKQIQAVTGTLVQ